MEEGAKRSYTGLTPRDMHQWLDTVDPSQGIPAPNPAFTRSGRTIRTPDRYDPSRYDKVQRELKDVAKAVELLKVESEKSKNSQVPKLEDVLEPTLPSVPIPSSRKGKSTSNKTTDKESLESDPFKRSSKMSRD
jgi:hypothetical protein